MVERGEGGSLVAISSLSAIHGAPGLEHYAASKTGLLAMVRCLAVELARHRVRVHAPATPLLPGWIVTDLNEAARNDPRFFETITRRTPVRRWGTPDDIGPAAVFLADPSYTFHTGDHLVVDGGYSIF